MGGRVVPAARRTYPVDAALPLRACQGLRRGNLFADASLETHHVPDDAEQHEVDDEDERGSAEISRAACEIQEQPAEDERGDDGALQGRRHQPVQSGLPADVPANADIHRAVYRASESDRVAGRVVVFAPVGGRFVAAGSAVPAPVHNPDIRLERGAAADSDGRADVLPAKGGDTGPEPKSDDIYDAGDNAGDVQRLSRGGRILLDDVQRDKFGAAKVAAAQRYEKAKWRSRKRRGGADAINNRARERPPQSASKEKVGRQEAVEEVAEIIYIVILLEKSCPRLEGTPPLRGEP